VLGHPNQQEVAMGFLDFLFGKNKNVCPACGTKGARPTDLPPRCPNPSCQYFDATLGGKRVLQKAQTQTARRGDYSPARPLSIRYRNFQGEEKTFTADAESLKRTKNHIIACVTPTGNQISLSRDRIQNLSEVEQAFPPAPEPGPPGPTRRERQVLGYHKKHGTTSPLYEQVRAKYPNW
jgi:hypothetical protein